MTAHGLLTDIRHVIRRLVAGPSFSLVAVLSLGLGISANTAVVSVARAALFDTLPIERPHELSSVFWDRGSMASAECTRTAGSTRRRASR
jgi:hypothetical protein